MVKHLEECYSLAVVKNYSAELVKSNACFLTCLSSMTHCSDVMKMVGYPIVHVNGDSPEVSCVFF